MGIWKWWCQCETLCKTSRTCKKKQQQQQQQNTKNKTKTKNKNETKSKQTKQTNKQNKTKQNKHYLHIHAKIFIKHSPTDSAFRVYLTKVDSAFRVYLVKDSSNGGPKCILMLMRSRLYHSWQCMETVTYVSVHI